MEEYTRKDLSEKVGASGPTINLWTVMKLVIPDYLPKGPGKKRRYGKHSLIDCFLIKIFQEKEFSLEEIKRILDGIRDRQYKNMKKILAKKVPSFYDDPNNYPKDFTLFHIEMVTYAGEFKTLTTEKIKDPENLIECLKGVARYTFNDLIGARRYIFEKYGV